MSRTVTTSLEAASAAPLLQVGLAVVVGGTLLLAAGIVAAASPAPRAVLLLPTTGEQVPAAVQDAVDVALESLALLAVGVETIGEDALRARLKRDPRALITECGIDERCVAKIGRSVDAEAVLLPRVVRFGAGFELHVLALDAATAEEQRRVTVPFTGVADIDAALAGREGAIFSGAASPPLVPVSPQAAPPVARDVWEGAAVSARPESARGTAPAPPWRPLRFVGLGGLVVAVGLASAGGVYALRYQRARDLIDLEGPRTTSLPEAVRLEARANRARTFARLGFVAAGVVAGVGLGLVIWDSRRPGGEAAAVGVTPAGVDLVAVW
ncbi:MAG: hypothetical protein HY903_04955 [Deltaproteobacteria bacterium]|nr:hypothetical protein [Deltaproteobacteria bacterium]